MGILEQFIYEYNEIYYKTLNKDSKSNIFDEIKQVEKIMTNPKFHPTNELKKFYKNLYEQYDMPLRIILMGNNALSKIMFLNVLFKSAIIPLNNLLIRKKFIVKFGRQNYTKAHYKNASVSVNLHNFDCSQASLDEVEHFEIFIQSEFLYNLEMIKDSDDLEKKSINVAKDMDLIIWFLEIKSKIIYHDNFVKLIKKKPLLTILTYINKNLEHNELLEQISTQTQYLNEQLNINVIYDIDLWNLIYEYRLDEKFMLYKTFDTLYQQIMALKTKFADNSLILLDNTKNAVTTFYTKKSETPIKQSQHDKIKNIIETINKYLQDMKTQRGIALLKEILEKAKLIDINYKTLFTHYKTLCNNYHNANKTLIAKVTQFYDEINKEIYRKIAKNLKRYFESIVDSILDNIEPIRIRTRPAQPSFFDNLVNKRIVYQGYEIYSDEIFKELDDVQSFLMRQHKMLVTRINRFYTYTTQYIENSLEDFDMILEEWIRQGHHLVLQKKNSIISMDSYFNLEEFNLSVRMNFTKKHNEIIYDFLSQIQTGLSALGVWVCSTRKMLLECVIRRLELKIQQDRILAKHGKSNEITPITRDTITDIMLDILPIEIQNLFCNFMGIYDGFDKISMCLNNEARENDKIVRYRMREMIELRQSLKIAIKMLEQTMQHIKA